MKYREFINVLKDIREERYIVVHENPHTKEIIETWYRDASIMNRNLEALKGQGCRVYITSKDSWWKVCKGLRKNPDKFLHY